MEDIFNRIANTIKPTDIYISAEIEVLKYSMEIDHVVYLYNDKRRVLYIDHSDFSRVMVYFELQKFTINSVVKTDSQYLISF